MLGQTLTGIIQICQKWNYSSVLSGVSVVRKQLCNLSRLLTLSRKEFIGSLFGSLQIPLGWEFSLECGGNKRCISIVTSSRSWVRITHWTPTDASTAVVAEEELPTSLL